MLQHIKYQLSNFESYRGSQYEINMMKDLRILLQTKDVDGGSLVRIGRNYDGGYIMLDEFNKNMSAYSFGISNDVSWDQMIADRGIDIYMYDHTISNLPYQNEKFHWKKVGICGNEKNKNCKSLLELINENGHANNMNLILKMDVEGAEWNSLIGIDESIIEQFNQMVFEFHDMNDLENKNLICAVLEKINKTHQCVHIHGNNYGPCKVVNGMCMPHAIECLYVRRKDHLFKNNNHYYPREFDMPCNPKFEEMILGKWNDNL